MPLKPVYLRNMEINWSASGLLPDTDDPSIGSEERIRNRDLAWRISIPTSSLQLVGAFFFYQLQKAKLQMLNPRASKALVYLSRRPEPDVRFVRGDLYVEVDKDPLVLLNLQNDAAEMGEFALECWEMAFPALSAQTDFPVEYVRGLMDRFREQNYAQGNTLKPQRILGSRAMARIHGVVSCARTVLKVEVSIDGEKLFERTIWDVPKQLFNVAYMERKIKVESGRLIVCPAALDLAPETSFTLESLPEEFLKTLE